VQFLGGAFILAGVTLVRAGELRTPAVAGRPEPPAPELAGAGPGNRRARIPSG
jgi:hypothetical protein